MFEECQKVISDALVDFALRICISGLFDDACVNGGLNDLFQTMAEYLFLLC